MSADIPAIIRNRTNPALHHAVTADALLADGEQEADSVVKEYLTTASDGKAYAHWLTVQDVCQAAERVCGEAVYG